MRINMINALYVAIIVVLTVSLICSTFSVSNALGKVKVTRGPVTCDNLSGGGARCCQTETGNNGIEIEYCTLCLNQNPPSGCGPRHQGHDVPPGFPSNNAGPKSGGVLDQPETPTNGGDVSNPNNNRGFLEHP